MAVLSQYTYIFALTTVFAFLDAWNIGKSHSPGPTVRRFLQMEDPSFLSPSLQQY